MQGCHRSVSRLASTQVEGGAFRLHGGDGLVTPGYPSDRSRDRPLPSACQFATEVRSHEVGPRVSPERSRGFEWIAADALLHPDGEARELG